MILPFLLSLAAGTTALSLNIASSGGNQSSSLLYGLFYEDTFHSGDGGLYGELIRNRAFQGSESNGQASLTRTTDYWHPVGGVSLSIDTSLPALSSSLPYHLRMDVPVNATGTVGLYNDGYWGFGVDATREYTTSVYVRGDYRGPINAHFYSTTSDQVLGSTRLRPRGNSPDGWLEMGSPVFHPTQTASNPNNTFYFTFDGAQLAGKSIYLNLFSVFKQTYNNRPNGVREDLALALEGLGTKFFRFPGGNNLEGVSAPNYWKWNETIGDLRDRPGRPGTWGYENTDGFGLLEQIQFAQDLGVESVLGVWAGLYLDGEIVAEGDLQPYVDSVMDELEFLLGDSSTTFGAQRVALGFPSPFTLNWVEIGNEDYLNGGTESYNTYRFNAFYNAIHEAYPSINIISTVIPSPVPTPGSPLDLHIYDNEAAFIAYFNEFDSYSRDYPLFVSEWAAIRSGTNSTGEIGAQTLGMACAEAIFLLGCERNSDVVIGSSYGALIKNYIMKPDTVALVKQTPNELLYTMSYYVQQLFAAHVGTETLPVTAADGGFGPVYWSATANGEQTILKMVNYNGSTEAVRVSVEGSMEGTATLISMTAPDRWSVNNLPALGGEASTITTTEITGDKGTFDVPFNNAYEIVILVV